MGATMPRLLIALVGRKGSGKGKVAQILKEKYNASVYRYSDILRDTLDRLFLEKSRENLVRASEALRCVFGEDLLQKTMIRQIEQDDATVVVLDGVRRLQDIENFETLGTFCLVNVEAPLDVRYERLHQRGENAGESTDTLETFKALEQASTEITIGDVEARATHTIHNDADLSKLEAQIDQLMTLLVS